ncbi:hypothetical protein [Stenotrophomonas sp. B1-1]|uniref:hypothetical protein n=1 Tax=Stenotrophomonas sp. B1-1 TaxID=2710648 RepID=UPI0013D993E6|nr:hypothetical protein [Stenotrophomonas sp. B1-1]
MALQQIDINTPQPNGKFGESTRSANIKHNSNITEVGQRLEALEADSGGAGEAIDDLRLDLQQEVLDRQQADADAGARIDAEQAARQQLSESVWERLRSLAKNLLINADFDIWQRRTSGRVGVGPGSLGSEAYFADRFSASALNCNLDVSRGIVGAGVTSLPPRVTNAILYNVNSLGSNPAAWSGQRIEDVRSAQGQVTLSMWLNGDAGRKVGVRAIQQFGSGGSASVTTEAGLIECPTTPTLVHITFTVPSTAGKTIGANSSLYLVIDFCGGGYGGQIASQSGAFAISEMQLEFGAAPTDFERTPEAVQLLNCQRYYQKSFPVGAVPGAGVAGGVMAPGVAFSGTAARVSQRFRVDMRATPAVTIYRSSETESGSANGVVLYNPSAGAWTNHANAANVSAATSTGFQVDAFATFAMTAGFSYLSGFNWTAEAELP